MTEDKFIPCTTPRKVAKGIVFRPLRSWHSGTFAGEGLKSVKGDGSGCIKMSNEGGWNHETCMPPYTVTHRWYYIDGHPEIGLSAFLSYPDRMGCSDGEYFWEALGTIGCEDDVERFFGPDAEAEMERAVIKTLRKRIAP